MFLIVKVKRWIPFGGKRVAHNASFNTFPVITHTSGRKIFSDPVGLCHGLGQWGLFRMVDNQFSLIKCSSHLKLRKMLGPTGQNRGRTERPAGILVVKPGRLRYGNVILSWIALNNSPCLEANDDACCCSPKKKNSLMI